MTVEPALFSEDIVQQIFSAKTVTAKYGRLGRLVTDQKKMERPHNKIPVKTERQRTDKDDFSGSSMSQSTEKVPKFPVILSIQRSNNTGARDNTEN